MIKVIHFDYRRYESEPIRYFLEKTFRDNPDVDYHDFEKSFPYDEAIAGLEALLPEKDVLLIHPGQHGQERVKEYPSLFPHLNVMMLVPGDLFGYGFHDKIELLGYENKHEVVEFILNSNL